MFKIFKNQAIHFTLLTVLFIPYAFSQPDSRATESPFISETYRYTDMNDGERLYSVFRKIYVDANSKANVTHMSDIDQEIVVAALGDVSYLLRAHSTLVDACAYYREKDTLETSDIEYLATEIGSADSLLIGDREAIFLGAFAKLSLAGQLYVEEEIMNLDSKGSVASVKLDLVALGREYPEEIARALSTPALAG